MEIPCDVCNGDGFVSHEDRHTENLKEVCPKCKGRTTIPARTGEVPEASASPDGVELYAHRVSTPKGESFVMEVLDVPRTTLEADDIHQGGKAPSLLDVGRKMPSMTAQQAADAWHGKDESPTIGYVDRMMVHKMSYEDKVEANRRFGWDLAKESKPTRLKQLYRHRPEDGVYGDCQRTCIAMLLGFNDPQSVPHFAHDNPPGGVFWDRVNAWLGEMGYRIWNTAYPAELSLRDILMTQGIMNPGTYYMLAGRSPRGTQHVVVCLGDAIWQDPHPDGGGIDGPDVDGYYRIEVLVPTRMTEFRRPRGHEDLPETPGPV